MRLLALLLALVPALAAAGVEVADSRGTHRFEAPPERVAALSWSLAEQVVELGLAPVAVADPEGYATWVAEPALPEGVEGVGLRQEPNLERLAALAPEVILISDDQIAFAPALERIAPVLHFETFSEEHDNAEAARETFRTLGRLLGREAVAEARLDALDARLAELREAVATHFDGAPPPVTVLRFVDAARVVVHGENAMTTHALDAVGLENGAGIDASKWGIAIRKVEELPALARGEVLHISPFPAGETLFASPIWRAMPFVREGRFHAIGPVWTYGGAMSLGRLAEAIAAALLATDPS
jgi:iron complex transport system substrate-binding protein